MGCASPQFVFYLFNGMSCTLAQDWTSTATFSWNTTGLAPGSYTVEAQARSGTSGTWQAYSDVPYTLGAPAPCSAVFVSASPSAPQAPGTTVEFTASAMGCTSPQLRFWVKPDGGTWSLAQDWSSSATFNWNTTGLALGGYTVEADARSGTSGSWQAYGQISYTLTAVGACTGVSLSPSPSSPQAVGTTILWTASATGCSSPQYLFYVRANGVWGIVQDWSTTATYGWSTGTLSAGDYLVEVDARNGGTGTWQAYIDVPYTLTSGACTGVGLSPSPASPQLPGTTILWTASAVGCGSPQYLFYFYNGTSWTLVQNWSSSATWSWNTTGLAPGAYTVEAEVRSGTSGTWQAYIDVPYTLSASGACTGVGLSGSPASPQVPGTTVLWTANAVGCGSPQFLFYLFNGTSWTLVQNWSSSATFSWDTTGLASGSYTVEAEARSGTSGTWQAYIDVPYTLSASSPCTGVGLSPSPASPQPSGTTVLWTANAVGCGSPQFLFYFYNSTSWTIVQNWSSTATWSWNTTGLAAGSYIVEAEVRSGTSGSWQAYIDRPYALTGANMAPIAMSTVLDSSSGAAATLDQGDKIVLDWRKQQGTRAAVRVAVEETLDRLPEAFTRQLYAQKCDAVYQHVFDSYWDDGRSTTQSPRD